MITEKEYSERVGNLHRKKYAQFFTPDIISDFMANWIVTQPQEQIEVLDPAFGLGVFCRSLLKLNSNIKVTGYDIDDKILKAAKENFHTMTDVVSIQKQDYLTSAWKKKYDGIICNPPYLKFHDYDNSRYIPEINSRLGTKLNGFTNIYTLFLLKSISLLKKGGRLAFIIPSEFLNSDYGVEVKRSLLKSKALRHIIIVDFTENAFNDALTTASILLCENSDSTESVHFSTTKDVTRLEECLHENKEYKTTDLDANIKWRLYYEDSQAKQYKHLVPFRTFAKVSRGIATGANNYFTFKRSKLDEFNINSHCIYPCICHAKDVDTSIFSFEDFQYLSDSDKNVYLFNGQADEHSASVREYIKIGEQHNIDKRYLTQSRSPWYSIENRVPSPIWVSVFNRNGLRFVRNEANVRNLTTFHCVYNIGIIETNILFAYLLTKVAKEIFLDNSRQYGNGLVKFEPNDLNKGLAVDLTLLTEKEKKYILRIYDLIRINKKHDKRFIDLLDEFFLKKYTGKTYDIDSMSLALDTISKGNRQITFSVKPQPRKPTQLNLHKLLQLHTENIDKQTTIH